MMQPSSECASEPYPQQALLDAVAHQVDAVAQLVREGGEDGVLLRQQGGGEVHPLLHPLEHTARERDRDTHTEPDRERQRQRHSDRDTHKERDRERDRDRERERGRDTHQAVNEQSTTSGKR